MEGIKAIEGKRSLRPGRGRWKPLDSKKLNVPVHWLVWVTPTVIETDGVYAGYVEDQELRRTGNGAGARAAVVS